MKEVEKKILKTILVFIIATIFIYLILTLYAFGWWCNKTQIELFKYDNSEQMLKLDSEKIQELGNDVKQRIALYESGLNDSANINDGENHTIDDGHFHTFAEFYDIIGLSVWSYLQFWTSFITARYTIISVFSGLAIAIAYAIITIKKIKIWMKVMFGYFAPMLVMPIIYSLVTSGRIISLYLTYGTYPMTYFYGGYTIVFVLILFINYVISKKMAKRLNEAMAKK